MDSTKIRNNFAENPANKYGAHNIELLSDKVTFDNNKGKFSFSYINPNIDTSQAKDTTLPKNTTSNMVNSNKNGLGISRITTSNYIELEVPKHLFYITDIKITPNTTTSSEGCLGSCNPVAVITRKEYTKGQKFIIVNSTTSYNEPVIIGVVEEG